MKELLSVLAVVTIMLTGCEGGIKLRAMEYDFPRVICMNGAEVVYDGYPRGFFKSDIYWIIEEANGDRIRLRGECSSESQMDRDNQR